MSLPAQFFDVRMRGFRDRADVLLVQAMLAATIQPLPSEPVCLAEAAGRVLAECVIADVDVPAFDRSAMDGYALRGAETFGAGSYNPLEFQIIGEAMPGRPCEKPLMPGQSVRIMTGAPLPAGADAVLQVENAEELGDLLRVSESVSPSRNVGKCGEDIGKGSEVLPAGRQLRPQDLGVLASIGKTNVAVHRRPTVDILITGNELLPCGTQPTGFRIVDSNSVMLRALVARDGGIVKQVQLVQDSREAVRGAVLASQGDVLLISGGSSVGKEDHAPAIVAELGELRVHGMALRPASPAGVGLIKEKPIFLLPGNPVSCLCAYDFFAGLAIRRLGARSPELPYRTTCLRLARKIVSPVGRMDYVRVALRDGQVEPLATSGAAILSSTTRADGFVLVPADSEGWATGEEVTVYLYDT